MTVDNQYDVYFGDQYLSSPTHVGGAANWFNTDTWNISTRIADRRLATWPPLLTSRSHKAFLGEFTNLTTGHSFVTSAASGTPWQVFAAGEPSSHR